MLFEKKRIHVSGGCAYVIIEIGYFSHDADVIGKAQQQLIVEFLQSHQIGL